MGEFFQCCGEEVLIEIGSPKSRLDLDVKSKRFISLLDLGFTDLVDLIVQGEQLCLLCAWPALQQVPRSLKSLGFITTSIHFFDVIHELQGDSGYLLGG